VTKRKYLYRKPDPRNPAIVRVYFRHPKTANLTALPVDEASSEFAAQYDVLFGALTAAPKVARDPNVRVKRNRDDGNVLYRPATLGWFVEKFLASKYFDPAHKDAYAEGTRYNYRKHLDLLKARLGGGTLVDLDQEAVEVYSAEVAREHGDSAGDDQISMISNLWEFAKGFKEFKRGGKINPTTRIKRHYQHDGEGHLVWPDEVIEKFDTDCSWHLQFVRMGLHYSGQRGGDVVRMKWEDFDGIRIHVVQERPARNCG
jgi:integrase